MKQLKQFSKVKGLKNIYICIKDKNIKKEKSTCHYFNQKQK